MNDLPMVLDDPIARPKVGSAARSTTRSRTFAPPGSSMTAVPWQWWMAPARAIGRVHPLLLAAAAADARFLARLPRAVATIAIPLAVFLLVLGVSLAHAQSTHGPAVNKVNWIGLDINDSYTEAALFIAIAVAIGAALPALGVFLALSFAVMDTIAAVIQKNEMTPLVTALPGRLVSLWLLWLLVVEIPTMGRFLVATWRLVAGNRLVVVGLVALTTGALTWVWTQAAVVLIRPLFIWSDARITYGAILPIQSAGAVFAVVAAIAAGASAMLHGPAGVLDLTASGSPVKALARVPPLVARLAVAALFTVALGGLISGPLDAVVLFAAFAGAGPLARWVSARTRLGSVVGMLPPIARYAAAAALVYVVAMNVVPPVIRARIPSEFFSVIVAASIGIFLVELATTPAAPGRSRPTAATSALVVVVLSGVLWLLMLAAPVAVLADDCSGLSDCWDTLRGIAIAASALPFAMAMAAGGGAYDKWRGNKYEIPSGSAVAGVRG